MIEIHEPTDFPEPDLEPCARCASGASCLAHAPLFGELADPPGRPAPTSWGTARRKNEPQVFAFEVRR